MDKITICDLEVFYRVGVLDRERIQTQRLLVSAEMTHDLSSAAKSDDLTATIDYNAIAQRLLNFGKGRSWKLIEKLAADMAELILTEFKPQTVSVELKKFIIPQARYVAVSVTRSRAPG